MQHHRPNPVILPHPCSAYRTKRYYATQCFLHYNPVYEYKASLSSHKATYITQWTEQRVATGCGRPDVQRHILSL